MVRETRRPEPSRCAIRFERGPERRCPTAAVKKNHRRIVRYLLVMIRQQSTKDGHRSSRARHEAFARDCELDEGPQEAEPHARPQ